MYSLTFLQTKRYPIQSFTDVYFYDAIREVSENESQEEIERLIKKTEKVAQLA